MNTNKQTKERSLREPHAAEEARLLSEVNRLKERIVKLENVIDEAEAELREAEAKLQNYQVVTGVINAALGLERPSSLLL